MLMGTGLYVSALQRYKLLVHKDTERVFLERIDINAQNRDTQPAFHASATHYPMESYIPHVDLLGAVATTVVQLQAHDQDAFPQNCCAASSCRQGR